MAKTSAESIDWLASELMMVMGSAAHVLAQCYRSGMYAALLRVAL